MSTVNLKIEIDAPIERVWETIMDPERLEEWVTIHRSVDHVSERPMTQGSTMDQVLQMRGMSFKVRWTLAIVNPPNLAAWEGQGPAHSRARIRYELSGGPEGPTTFEYTNELSPPGGRLGITAGRVIVGPTSEREARSSLSRLKALLEQK